VRWNRLSTKAMKSTTLSVVSLFVVLILAATQGTSNLFQLSLIAIYATAAVGLNLAIGFGGQLFLGQVAIMGLAGYTAGILNVRYSLSPIEVLIPALFAGTLLGLFTGLVGLRLTSIYIGLVSFFMVVVLENVVDSFQGLTNGENGLGGLSLFFSAEGRGGALASYFLAVFLLVVTFVVFRAILLSGWGTRFRALRDAPEALASCGLSPTSTRMVIYTLTSLVAALAGWGLVFLNGLAAPGLFSVNLTLLLLAAVAVGGQGTILGPIIGMVLVGGYSDFVGAFSTYNVLVLGVILVVVVLIFPRGIAEFGGRSSLNIGRLYRLRKQGATSQPPVQIDLQHGEIPGWLGNIPTDGLALDLKSVSKSFSGVHAVIEVEMNIGFGSVVGLVGANGSGKTTLVNLITGIYPTDEGRIAIADVELKKKQAHRVSNLGVARTFQVPQLIGESSVRENIELGLLRQFQQPVWLPVLRPLRSHRIDRGRKLAAEELLEWLSVPKIYWDRPVDGLPLGLQRVLEVGRAISTGSSLVCLDEPAAGLNQEELDLLADLIAVVAHTGRAILLVEHNRRFVARVADFAVLMEGGRCSPSVQVDAKTHLPGFLFTISEVEESASQPIVGGQE
jgi:ABC-type branched-subunit amino acid transport system ATPase component/ABC-type branched-subunit amino acid transport system permease subunit